jgi:integrase
VLGWLRARDSSCEIATALARFHAHKIATAGGETPWIGTQHNLLTELATAFAGRRLSEISSDDLAEWWTTRGTGLSAKSRKDIRGHLVSFWRWSYRQGLAGSDAVTAPERLPSIPADPGDKRVFTPAELCAVLNAVHRDFRAWGVLGAFGGLRPEEIAPGPSKRASKRGILCEEIDWQFSVIRLPATVSKVNRPRIVPMSDALKAGLLWAGIEPGMVGRTTLRNPSQDQELSRLGRDLFQGPWPKDALRHSYGSYRNACLRNLDQVAEEMGTSVAMLHRHYHNPQPQAMGDAWFGLRPAADGRWIVPAATATRATEIEVLRLQA